MHTREHEGVYVIDGVLTAEEQRLQVGPGAFLWIPRGIPHTFANLGDDPVRALGLINPRGFEQFFAGMAEYLASSDGGPDPEVILQLNQRYGVSPARGRSTDLTDRLTADPELDQAWVHSRCLPAWVSIVPPVARAACRA